MRGHRLKCALPTQMKNHQWGTRENSDFGIISRGGRTGFMLLPNQYQEIKFDGNIIFLHGTPFDIKPIMEFGSSTPMLSKQDITMWFEIT